MNTLRAVIDSSDDESFFEAQLLELDIAVSARSMEQLIAEVEHALIMEFHLANLYRIPPFSSVIQPVPKHLENRWSSSDGGRTTSWDLHIPDVVAESLASALQAGNHQLQVQVHYAPRAAA